ncbi:MAG: FAD-dependent oxidoreductase [Candidatus Obscuribacterales bacterium]
MEKRVTVIGGGLAGSEAAWQLASLGIPVDLYEMRPVIKSPAHHTSNLAELVCSNSLGSFAPQNASALLKDEMRVLGSKILEIAYQCQVPAGNALAVDRDAFAQTVTATIENHPLIKLHRQEMPRIKGEGITIIATAFA